MKQIILLTFLICALSASAKTIHIVKNGKLTEHAKQLGTSWKQEADHVAGHGSGEKLLFPYKVKSKRFSITAKLSLKEFNQTAAGICIGSEYFGFDGSTGYFTEGGCFGGLKLIEGSKPDADSEFTFRAVAMNGKIAFSINGKNIATRPYDHRFVNTVALRPHRGHMKIKEFKVSGVIKGVEELNHLFACGKEGYQQYRIPALVTTTKGSLLAFCEGRKTGSKGGTDIVFKRSTDNGKTWSSLLVAFNHPEQSAGTPTPIIDQTTGRIHLIFCTATHTETETLAGKGRRKICIQHSDDDGKTWSKVRDISTNIYPENWRWYATGPGSGIQIQKGRYKGRLVCPANHTFVKEGGSENIFRAHCIYSDDLGKTWKLGDPSGPGGGESSIAEAEDNRLFQTIRMQTHSKGLRGTRFSRNGGITWTPLKNQADLPCPRCQGAVIRDYSQPSRLIHSNPSTGKGRTGMTIRISEDGGRTWPYAKLILPSSSAYSDLSITADNKVAILYEGGHHAYENEGIIFESHHISSAMQPRKK